MGKRKSIEERNRDVLSLGRASYASKSAIEKLVAEVRTGGLPEGCDRSVQYRARKAMAATEGQYGKLVVELPIEGVPTPTNKKDSDPLSQTMGFQNPLAFFEYNCRESPHYAKIVQRANEKHPCTPATPWHLIIYQDGVDPSDGLGKNHSRKSCVFYWAFAEFGMHALCHEEVWGTLCVMRSTQCAKLKGNISQLFEKILGLFFGDKHDIRLSGITVCVKSGEHEVRITVFAEVRVLLADEPALKEMLDCKGHAGHKPCCLCIDGTLHNARGTPIHTLCSNAVSIAIMSWDAFKKHSDASIRAVVMRMNDLHQQLLGKTITQDDYDNRSAVLGWNWSPTNIILNEKFRLQVASSVMFDWAHVYVHDGLADTEFGQCMKVFHTNRTLTTFNEVGRYVHTVTFPKSSPNPNHLFTTSANANNARKGAFMSSGSEFMTLVPVLHRYFSEVVTARGEFLQHVQSMLAVLTVVMLLQAVKTGTVSAATLMAAITTHLTLYVACYGDDAARPKHHYALHLPDMLDRFGFLLATFVHERKHRLVTRYTRNRMNLKSWDLGAIEDITCHQLWELRQPFFLVYRQARPKRKLLWTLQEMFPGVMDNAFTIASDISCNGGRLCQGDVVSCFIDGRIELGELLVTVGISTDTTLTLHSIVALWQPAGAIRPTDDVPWVNFIVSDDRVVSVETTKSIDTVFTYRMASNRTSCMVYFPYEVRPKP